MNLKELANAYLVLSRMMPAIEDPTTREGSNKVIQQYHNLYVSVGQLPLADNLAKAKTVQAQVLQEHLWMHFGFPTVRIQSQTYAAALMSTAPPQGHIEPPWPCFFIQVPGDLIFAISPEDGSKLSITQIRVCYIETLRPSGQLENSWTIAALAFKGEKAICLWRLVNSTDNLREAFDKEVSAHDQAFEFSNESSDNRCLQVIARLILNICTEIGTRIASNKPSHHVCAATQKSNVASLNVLKIGAPIDLDCRPALKDFLDGKRRGPATVRWLVRGHWRDQACGQALSDKRHIWIRPYWKGLETGPTLMRTYNIGGDR